MALMTITEGLAELKTIEARLEKKREFAQSLLARQEFLKDPHEKEDGGSRGVLERERQSILDLEERVITIRSAIQGANRENLITIGQKIRTIHDWIVWRRDISKNQKEFLARMRNSIESLRRTAQSKGYSVVQESSGQKPTDLIINVDEMALARQIEGIEEVLGTLDGQLSLKNATITIDV